MRAEKLLSTYKKKHKEKRRLMSCFLVLALLISTVVSTQLHVTGISMTNEVQCGKEEHTHSDECYLNGNLICYKEEHVHNINCMSDQLADVETESDWEKTLPDKLTGNWSDDLVATAQSQIGYRESNKNFEAANDGSGEKGYTRYGAWYGNEYGSWDAMFVSFCLYYADIASTDFIYSAGRQTWKDNLTDLDMYKPAKNYTPKKGDVIFLKLEDGSEETDQVGIVESVDKDKITTIEGDKEDTVKKEEYKRDDTKIVGYGVLPENPDAENSPEVAEEAPQAEDDVDPQIIKAIENKLGLTSYSIPGTSNKANFSLTGKEFTQLFYYGNVARDDRVPFSDAKSYRAYLAQCYENDLKNGTNTLETEWNKYLYDLFDPTNLQGKMGNKTSYPDATTYGDCAPHINWPKDGGSGPFHATDSKVTNPDLKKLTYSLTEQQVKYDQIIRDFDKKVTAQKAGDQNIERKYDVELSAKVQAAINAPIVMIMQIQTSWQMFDLAHANCVKGDGTYDKIEVGACANNSAIANLYDIKQALIRFIKDWNQQYPGNNLAIGITDVEHGGTWSMLGGSGARGKNDTNTNMYVSNDVDTLLEGLYGWDTFGNCEHVHYKSTALENAVTALDANLGKWYDAGGSPVDKNYVRKIGVMIGGGTENTDGDSGYGITLPWSNFQKAKLNSVYGIRTNEGVPLAPSKGGGGSANHPISWIDYEGNNGTPFKDGTGSGFTKKYVATTEDAVYKRLMDIAKREIAESPIPIESEEIEIKDTVLTDIIQDEFELDKTAPIKVAVLSKDGGVEEELKISLEGAKTEKLTDGTVVTTTANGKFKITENTNGTTTVAYTYGTVKNIKTVKLNFGIKAKENYIGSNNVLSNVGTPKIDYKHVPSEPSEPVESFTANCDKTPEINVPIRFNTKDGEKTLIMVGETTNLNDLTGEITKDAETRVQAYDQINGTLSYTWVLPDGQKVSAGSVPVINGSIGNGAFPEHPYEFPGEKPGNNEIRLNVTFTPNVVKDNGNYSDDKTKTAVNALTNPGKVWVDVIDGDSKRDLIVRKDWVGGDAPAGQEIAYKLLANGKEVKTGTLSAENNWKELYEDLPVVDKASKEIITYTVGETTKVPGYTVSYGTDIQTDTETKYAATIKLKFSVSEIIGADKELKFTYTYGGKSYTYTQQKNAHQEYKSGNTYEINIPGNFGLDADGNPATVRVTSLLTVKDNKYKTVYDKGSTATKIKISEVSTSTDVLVIKNVLNTTVSMQIHKTNDSGRLSLPDAEFELLTEDGKTVVDRGVTDEQGILTLSGITTGQRYLLKETKAPEGYLDVKDPWNVEVTKNGEIKVSQNGKTLEAENGQFQITNEAGYALPDSGGFGGLPYTVAGSILMLIAFMYGYSRRKKSMKGGSNQE